MTPLAQVKYLHFFFVPLVIILGQGCEPRGLAAYERKFMVLAVRKTARKAEASHLTGVIKDRKVLEFSVNNGKW